MAGRAAPTSEEVIAKLKDDGDFDTLRLGIIRKVKENEELRNIIINEVKQSAILNLEASEDMKPRQLSDGIYQEVGSKIMGQISDEIWRVIRSDDSKSKIRETVESVYDSLINPQCKNEDRSSPHKQLAGNANNVHASPTNLNMKNEVKSSPHKQQAFSGSNANSSPPPASTSEIALSDCVEAPPGFASSDQQISNNSKEEEKEMLLDQRPSSSSREVNHHLPEVHQPSYDDELPPGFAPPHDASEQPCGGSDEDPDVPPGFG